MKPLRVVLPSMLILVCASTLHLAAAQQEGIKRTDLQQHDLSIPRRASRSWSRNE